MEALEQTMPEPDQQQQEIDKQNDKRLKAQGGSRDYICGCGKSYYSYSALYLHIRSKHDSKNPEGTKYPRPDKGNVGRPKKDLQGVEQEDLIDPDQPLDELLIYLQDYYKRSCFPEDQKYIYIQDITKESIDALSSFPLNLFNSNEMPQNVYAQIDQILSSENEEIQKDQAHCNFIFAYFLVTFSKHITERCFKEICFFAMMLRKTLNLIGKDHIELESPEKYDEKKEFCDQKFGNMIPLIGNDFITEYLPKFIKEYESKIQDFQILGLSETQVNNSEKIFAVFCDWLFKNEFTNHTVQGKFQQNSSDSEYDDDQDEEATVSGVGAGANSNQQVAAQTSAQTSQELTNNTNQQQVENGGGKKKNLKKQKDKNTKKQQKQSSKIEKSQQYQQQEIQNQTSSYSAGQQQQIQTKEKKQQESEDKQLKSEQHSQSQQQHLQGQQKKKQKKN